MNLVLTGYVAVALLLAPSSNFKWTAYILWEAGPGGQIWSLGRWYVLLLLFSIGAAVYLLTRKSGHLTAADRNWAFVHGASLGALSIPLVGFLLWHRWVAAFYAVVAGSLIVSALLRWRQGAEFGRREAREAAQFWTVGYGILCILDLLLWVFDIDFFS